MKSLTSFGPKPYHDMHQPGSMTGLCVQPECSSYRTAIEPIPLPTLKLCMAWSDYKRTPS